MKMPYDNNQGGAFHSPDHRDYRWELLAGAMGIQKEFDWEKGFDCEAEIGFKVRHENQDGSGSCTGQAAKVYGEILEYKETGVYRRFSAKDVYYHIYLPEGGAFIRDALKHCVKRGFVLEADVPSYDNGNPPTEEYMREDYTITEAAKKRAKMWQSKEYYAVPINIDETAVALKNNLLIYLAARGSNKGWQTAHVRPPKSGERTWGHAFIGKGACLKKKGAKKVKAIKCHNSWGERWGEKGDFYLDEEYFRSGNMYDPYVLIDKNNINLMMLKLVKIQNSSTVYLVDATGHKHPFYDEKHFTSVAPLLGLAKKGEEADWSQVEVVSQADLDKYPEGRGLFLSA